MYVAVLNVNILASAAVSERGAARTVVAMGLRRQFQLVGSTHILKKLDDTFQRPYFSARVDVQARAEYFELLREKSRSREPDSMIRGVRIVSAARFLEVLETEP